MIEFEALTSEDEEITIEYENLHVREVWFGSALAHANIIPGLVYILKVLEAC